MSNGNILIVDDDSIIRRLIQSGLQQLHCTITIASNGAEALSQAMMQLPDVILLDLRLPDIDGFTVCQQLRHHLLLAEVPIIMMTSSNDPEVRMSCLKAGADDFIAKPIDFLELRARVSSILRLNRYRLLLQERTYRQQTEREMLRRSRELTLLNSFIISTASRLPTSQHIERAMYSACQVLAEAFDLDRTYAWLLSEDRQMLVACAHYYQPAIHADNTNAPIDLELACALTPCQQSDPWDLAVTENPIARTWVQSHPHHSILLVPLIVNGAISGALALQTEQTRTFDDHERAYGQSLAGALAQAIEATLLHQQLARTVDHLEEIVAQRTNELQTERDRTQAILESLGEAVIVTNAEGLIHYVNPAMTQLTGYTADQLVGHNWHAMRYDTNALVLYQNVPENIDQRRAWRGEVTGVRRDGTTYDTAITVEPFFDPDTPGQVAGLVSVQRDITPLKAAERTKDQFISHMSHEFRTPLSVIVLHSGNLDMLYKRLNDEQRQRLIREIRAQADVLNDLIGDVLELSRIDSGRMVPDREPINMASLLQREVEQLRPLAERKQLRMEITTSANLFSAGDEIQLRQVLRNLIANAIKFTNTGGMVSCECRLLHEPLDPHAWPNFDKAPSGNWIGTRVIDTGVGMAAEYLPHLFQRFYRIQAQSSIPGTGLGLAIAHELVTHHGGWFGVASTPGQGSVFAFYLPVA